MMWSQIRSDIGSASGRPAAPEDFSWQPSDADTYETRFGMVPPAEQRRSAFLYGEAIDLRGDGGIARFLAYRVRDGIYEAGSRPVTRGEFRAIMEIG